MKQLVFIAIGFGAQVVASPTFIGICGASDDPGKCLLIRIGIVASVWLVLNLLAGGNSD